MRATYIPQHDAVNDLAVKNRLMFKPLAVNNRSNKPIAI